MVHRVMNENHWGLKEFHQHIPTPEETANLVRWIQDATEQQGSLSLVLGDRGTERFYRTFEQTKTPVLFVDSGMQKEDPCLELENAFGICAAFSDLLHLIHNEATLQQSLTQKIQLIFDDWSIFPWEKHNYGLGTDPFEHLTLSEKNAILLPLLMPSGRIYTSTLPFSLPDFYELQFDFDVKLCKLNVRKHPEFAFNAPALTDSHSYGSIPTWVLNPKTFVIEAIHYTPTAIPDEELTVALNEPNFLEDLKTYFFADGCFGDRLVVLEKKKDCRP